MEYLLTMKDKLNFKVKGICQFGSLVNGFGSQTSDTDLTIITDNYVDEIRCLDNIYDLMT